MTDRVDLRGARVTAMPTLHRGDVDAVDITADGRLAASGGDDGIRLWDPGTGAPLGALGGPRMSVASLCLSADGTRLLSGARSGEARLWDTGGRAAGVLRVPTGEPAAAARRTWTASTCGTSAAASTCGPSANANGTACAASRRRPTAGTC